MAAAGCTGEKANSATDFRKGKGAGLTERWIRVCWRCALCWWCKGPQMRCSGAARGGRIESSMESPRLLGATQLVWRRGLEGPAAPDSGGTRIPPCCREARHRDPQAILDSHPPRQRRGWGSKSALTSCGVAAHSVRTPGTARLTLAAVGCGAPATALLALLPSGHLVVRTGVDPRQGHEELTERGRSSWLQRLGGATGSRPRAAPRRPTDAGSGRKGQYRRNRPTAGSLSRARTRVAARRSPVRQDQARKSPPACGRARTPGDWRADCRATLDTHPGGRAGCVPHPASAALATCGFACGLRYCTRGC